MTIGSAFLKINGFCDSYDTNECAMASNGISGNKQCRIKPLISLNKSAVTRMIKREALCEQTQVVDRHFMIQVLRSRCSFCPAE
jgi:hypothetical protein